MSKIPNPGKKLGGRLRLAREEADMTASQMADVLSQRCARDVAGSTITGWERNVSRPSLEQIEAWAEITDVDLMWLTFGRAPQFVGDGDLPTSTEDDWLEVAA